ncbi:MAG: glutamine amidotransferase [bacterium]|nr:glutamine amidotransferase [bacterium]
MNVPPEQGFFWQTAAGLFRSRLSWEQTLPTAVVFVLAIGFAALLFLQWHDLRNRVKTSTRCSLCLLRGVVYLFIFGMVLNPALLNQKVLRLLPSLLVAVDTSASMALSESDGKSRLQHALDYLHHEGAASLQTLAQYYQIKFYQFAETAQVLPLEQLQQVQGNGSGTNIVGALVKILEENRAASPSGVLLFSDGAQHGPSTGLDYIRQAGIPVVTVGLGQPAAYQDIRVVSVQAPTLSFLHYPVKITATVHTWGYQGKRLPVVLKRAGRVVATQTIEVNADVFEQQVLFEITPDELGEFIYTVSIAPHLGEALSENNHKDFPISIARDKIRILLVCGSPTWNYRFLRQAFKHDPSIDLISFVILRTPTDVVNVPENQLSLIPFPTRRLFTKELQNFDLIVFENFSFQFYFPWYYLENVRKYVSEGGAFAMLGGRLSFAQGGYAGTPIEEILPVSLRQGRKDYRTVAQHMTLTPEGKVHPITRLSADTKENHRIWNAMPDLDAINVPAQAKAGATVLGVSKRQLDSGKTVPILATQRFGKGRTLALMSDYIWKWNYHLAGRMDSNQYYLQFIRQMVHWLIRDPILKQIRVMADAHTFSIGNDITGTLQVLQDDYQPAVKAVLRVQLQTPSGAELSVPYTPTANPGEYRYRVAATEEGLYTLDVQAQIGGTTHESNRLLLQVKQPGDERQQAVPNHALLTDIADRTGGAFFSLHDDSRPTLAGLPEFFGGTPKYEVLEEKRFRLRETLAAFLIVVGCLSIEWLWRRRAGLF